uniref:AH domain-containing protein n=1 Tax=Angiostrongylus cantonensis TaxID=6313 RepID=A0A0K0DH76_ANGCA
MHFRFYQELHVFAERAIFDCLQTVEAVERARLEYRGSLLWMKKTSEEVLDPDTDRQLEKFREAQSAVRLNKEKLDKLKVDTLQKVDLLSASRSNLLAHLLGKYLEALCAYYEKTGRAYSALSENLSTFQHYEFEILTDLIEPSKNVAKKLRQESMEKEARDGEYSQLPTTEASDQAVVNLLDLDDKPEASLKKYLFGRESPNEEKLQELEEQRPESPHRSTSQINRYRANKPFSFLDENTDKSGYSVQDLFPLVNKPKDDQGSIVDLLGIPSTQFPNPFDERKTTEWDLLLSQCDFQQSNDLI